MGKTIPGLRFHWQREQIEDWTDGRSLRGTAFDGISENGFKLAKIGYLGANFSEMGGCQSLHLGARGPARFGESKQISNCANRKSNFTRAADERQPLYVLVTIIPVTVCGALRFRHEANALVIPYCLQMDARGFRERGNGKCSHSCEPVPLDSVAATDSSIVAVMEIADMSIRPAESQTASRPAPEQTSSTAAVRLTAIGGVLGAIAASSCCIAPLALFSLGVSGAWIGNLTALAPYQPYFISATLICLGYGYWLVYRSRRTACAKDAACARTLPSRAVMTGLVLATLLVAVAIGLDLIGPYFLTP
jgi:mercuric ion transport protein